jgi:hypothetical protein
VARAGTPICGVPARVAFACRQRHPMRVRRLAIVRWVPNKRAESYVGARGAPGSSGLALAVAGLRSRGRGQTLVEPRRRCLATVLARDRSFHRLSSSADQQRASGTFARHSQSMGARRAITRASLAARHIFMGASGPGEGHPRRLYGRRSKSPRFGGLGSLPTRGSFGATSFSGLGQASTDVEWRATSHRVRSNGSRDCITVSSIGTSFRETAHTALVRSPPFRASSAS